MYAIIKTGGKQYKVKPGDIVDTELLPNAVGGEVVFNEVLAMGEGADVQLGTPLVEGAAVEGEVLENFRGKKVIAFKMKRRKGYRHTIGHRQDLVKLRIKSISLGGKTVAALSEQSAAAAGEPAEVLVDEPAEVMAE